MHPLDVLNEAELGSLTRVADRLLNTRHLLAPGLRPNRLRAGFGIEFLDHREFTPGDDIRDVDWRTTARSRHPQIRRYCDEAATDWFILLDCSSSMVFEQAEKWALAVQSAAAMAYLLIHQGNRVSVLMFSNKIEQMVPLGRGYTHYASILQKLRQTTAAEHGSQSDLRCCVSKIKRNSPIFVISDFLTPNAMQDGLDALSIRGDKLHALQIYSGKDFNIPEAESIRFKDVETAQIITTDLSSSQREQYLESVINFNNSLVNFCLTKRIHFSHHDVTEIWKSALINHLKAGYSQS